MSSLVPGYMTVSWTVNPPAVGVRATCGVEGRPEGGGRGWVCLHTRGDKRKVLCTYIYRDTPFPSVSVGSHS